MNEDRLNKLKPEHTKAGIELVYDEDICPLCGKGFMEVCQ